MVHAHENSNKIRTAFGTILEMGQGVLKATVTEEILLCLGIKY